MIFFFPIKYNLKILKRVSEIQNLRVSGFLEFPYKILWESHWFSHITFCKLCFYNIFMFKCIVTRSFWECLNSFGVKPHHFFSLDVAVGLTNISLFKLMKKKMILTQHTRVFLKISQNQNLMWKLLLRRYTFCEYNFISEMLI